MPVDIAITVPEFVKLVEELGSGVDNAIEVAKQDVATTLKNYVLKNTPVGIRKKKSGEQHLKWTWSQISQIGDGSLTFGTTSPYSTVLEEGAYPGVGPRTVKVGTGIFSRQAPGGMVAPLLADDRLIDDIIDQIVDALKKGVEDASAGNVY